MPSDAVGRDRAVWRDITTPRDLVDPSSRLKERRRPGDHPVGMPSRDLDPGLVDDPRLPEWAEQAVADRLLAGEPRSQAELRGYADAIAALALVREIEAG